MDWDNSFSVAVADSLHRDEFGAKGRLSNTGAGTEKDGVMPAPTPNRGMAAATGSNAATAIKIGRAAVAARGTPPSWRLQVRACRLLPEASCVGMQGMSPLTLMFARSSPLGLIVVWRLAYKPRLLADTRLLKIALVKPNAAVQVEVTVAEKGAAEPVVTQPVSGESPQRPNRTCPTASAALESKWMCTPVRALVRPVATTVTNTDAGGDSESWENVTVAEPAEAPVGTRDSESAEALQMMLLNTGSILARSSPLMLLLAV